MRRVAARLMVVATLVATVTLAPGTAIPAQAADPCAPEMDATTVPGTTILQFKTVGDCDWTVPAGVTSVEVLIVAGGGGGGGRAAGGGGGAGAVLHGSSIAVSPETDVTVTVGGGGVGGASSAGAASRGGSGGNSAFGSAIALGGGGGGGYNPTVFPPTWGLGASGGSAGGHGELASITESGSTSTQAAVAGYVTYGNSGGGQLKHTQSGSGGGGAGAAGGRVTALHKPGAGGAGQSFSITGTAVTYAGGGGGAGWIGVSGGAGGSGGGGAGAKGGDDLADIPAVAGTANSGGGGGGGMKSLVLDGVGAAGGSGVVIVRYSTTYTVTFDPNGGTGTMAPQTSAAPAALTANAYVRSGYTFSGWNTDQDGGGTPYANQATYPFGADDTIYAQWTRIPSPPRIPPSAPLQVMGLAGDASATIQWNPPASPGTSPITTYEAVVAPGGQRCVVEVPVLSCTISGLTNGVGYTATVRASSLSGVSAPSSASAEFTPRATPTITITGTRGVVRGGTGIVVTGTTGLASGAVLRPWVRFSGQTAYSEGSARLVVAQDGGFTWQRRTAKRIYVIVKAQDGALSSNRIIVKAS
jgi:uncharacterized repeat protein (TIGR02543 family)